MKHLCLSGIIFLLMISCESEDFSGPQALEYTDSFPVESRPVSIQTEGKNGNVLVLNINHFSIDYSAKLTQYDKTGRFLKTLLDFATFTEGSFQEYIPVDFTLGQSGDIYVIGRPVTGYTEDYMITASGFSILVFSGSGVFTGEYDYSEEEGCPGNICQSGKFLYADLRNTLYRFTLPGGSVELVDLPEDPDGSDGLFGIRTDMEAGSNGLLYFSGPHNPSFDSSGCRILTYDLQEKTYTSHIAHGADIVMASMVGSPGLAVHENGDLYLATFYGASIEVYDPGMNFLLEQKLEGPGEEHHLSIDVAVFEDLAFVADYRNDLVHIYRLTGTSR